MTIDDPSYYSVQISTLSVKVRESMAKQDWVKVAEYADQISMLAYEMKSAAITLWKMNRG